MEKKSFEEMERQELTIEIKDLYNDIFDGEIDGLDDMTLDELKDVLSDLSDKEPIIKHIKAIVGEDDLDYTNLNELTIEGLLELAERLEDDEEYDMFE